MGKLGFCISSRIYQIKKQYPVIKEFDRGIRTVERELNSDGKREKPRCCNACKSRQKH